MIYWLLLDDWIQFDFISGHVYYLRPATESNDSVAKSVKTILICFFQVKHPPNLFLCSIAGQFEFAMDTMGS